MDEQSKQIARDRASRAGRQVRHAARNGIGAAREVVEGVADDVVEEAQDTGEKLVGTAKDASKNVSPAAIGFIASETGQGFIGIAVAIAAGIFAGNRFRSAKDGAKQVIQ